MTQKEKEIKITVPKVTNATFKGDEIWYFVEPMDGNYTPSQKKFVEKSTFGALEGTIIFNERR